MNSLKNILSHPRVKRRRVCLFHIFSLSSINFVFVNNFISSSSTFPPTRLDISSKLYVWRETTSGKNAYEGFFIYFSSCPHSPLQSLFWYLCLLGNTLIITDKSTCFFFFFGMTWHLSKIVNPNNFFMRGKKAHQAIPQCRNSLYCVHPPVLSCSLPSVSIIRAAAISCYSRPTTKTTA